MWDASSDKCWQLIPLELEGGRPETPNHIDADDRPNHVPAATGDQHRPEDECAEKVSEGIRRDGPLLEGVKRATRAHDRRSQDEPLQLEGDDVLAGGRGGLFIFTDCAGGAP